MTTMIYNERKEALKNKVLNLAISQALENEFILKTNCGDEVLINTKKLTREQNGFQSYDFIFIRSKLFIVIGVGKPCNGVNSTKKESIFLLEENSNGICCWDVMSFNELQKHYNAKWVL